MDFKKTMHQRHQNTYTFHYLSLIGMILCVYLLNLAKINLYSEAAQDQGLLSSKNEPLQTSGLKLTESNRVIHVGDMIKITTRFPDRAFGSLEAVQKSGDVATPEGSYVKADGLSLETFCANLKALYAKIPSYEKVEVEAYIYSSPYRVVKYNPHQPSSPKSAPSQTASTNTISGVNITNLPPATLLPRIFKAPLTIWEAIQLEEGIPKDVNPKRIKILKRDLQRKILDCSGANGSPDGTQFLESGDYLFLVPENAPLSNIFD